MSDLPKSLARKMAAVMGDAPTMIKNGQNVAQRYEYVTADDVKAAIRPLLKKHGIAVFSAMTDVTRETGTNKNGTHTVTVLAKMMFSLVCTETGECVNCEWYGEANDYADKAVNKAATAAEKYWLINTFLLSTTEPESDEVTISMELPEIKIPESLTAADGRYPVEPAGRITKTQMATIRELSKARWGEDYKDEGVAYVMRVYGCALADLSDHDAERMIADLKSKTEAVPT
jgi:hypothetical protein